MRPFAYERAESAEVAVAALAADPDASFIAGGTSLVDLMSTYTEMPGRLVDVSRIPGLDAIEAREDGLSIGALARNSDVGAHPAVRELYPALSEALLAGASPQVRNAATMAGNLLQRTRCGYFRNNAATACNKREPGSGCAAIEGEHRGLAILGTSDRCVANHPSDMAVALAALDAIVETVGPGGRRSIPVEGLHLLPGDTPEKETVLERGELIVAIRVPDSSFAARSHYLKTRDRASFAYALVSAAVALEVEDGTIKQARVALGGVAPKPWRAYASEEALVGATTTPETFRAAGEAAVLGASPLKDNAFKVEFAKRVVARALSTVGGAS